jgi:hypothetical protein
MMRNRAYGRLLGFLTVILALKMQNKRLKPPLSEKPKKMMLKIVDGKTAPMSQNQGFVYTISYLQIYLIMVKCLYINFRIAKEHRIVKCVLTAPV